MEDLISSDDPVFLSWLTARLEEDGIAWVMLDGHTMAAFAGALGRVRARIQVAPEDLGRARWILAEAPSP